MKYDYKDLILLKNSKWHPLGQDFKTQAFFHECWWQYKNEI